jgi:hypothetical protein
MACLKNKLVPKNLGLKISQRKVAMVTRTLKFDVAIIDCQIDLALPPEVLLYGC